MLFDQAYAELELIDRHIRVLKFVAERGPIGILKLAEETGLQAHKIRYSLRILEQNGLIKPSPQGAVAGDRLEEFLETAEPEVREIKRLTLLIEENGKNIGLKK
jgi:predicted transcriptional regulator